LKYLICNWGSLIGTYFTAIILNNFGYNLSWFSLNLNYIKSLFLSFAIKIHFWWTDKNHKKNKKKTICNRPWSINYIDASYTIICLSLISIPLLFLYTFVLLYQIQFFMLAIIIKLLQSKDELRQSFSTCVYCMLLRFQSNYLGWLMPA